MLHFRLRNILRIESLKSVTFHKLPSLTTPSNELQPPQLSLHLIAFSSKLEPTGLCLVISLQRLLAKCDITNVVKNKNLLFNLQLDNLILSNESLLNSNHFVDLFIPSCICAQQSLRDIFPAASYEEIRLVYFFAFLVLLPRRFPF